MSSRPSRRSFLATTAAAVVGAASISGSASASKPAKSSRFATFNIYELDTKQVQHSGDQQAAAAARIIQEVQPDVLVVNELTNNQQQSKATDTPNAEAFLENYLSVSQKKHLEPLEYPYYFEPAVNTGVASRIDLNNDGMVDTSRGDSTYANDAFGFGLFPGQYGFAIFSRYPINTPGIRTFQEFLWRDMPDSHIATDPNTDLYLSSAEIPNQNAASPI